MICGQSSSVKPNLQENKDDEILRISRHFHRKEAKTSTCIPCSFKELLPKHKTNAQAFIRSKDFSRKRKPPIPIVLALIVRPGMRFGYREALNQRYSDTGLRERKNSCQKPQDRMVNSMPLLSFLPRMIPQARIWQGALREKTVRSSSLLNSAFH